MKRWKTQLAGVAAVLGFDTARVVEACREASATGSVVVAANLNEPTQTVISGDPEAVAPVALQEDWEGLVEPDPSPPFLGS